MTGLYARRGDRLIVSDAFLKEFCDLFEASESFKKTGMGRSLNREAIKELLSISDSDLILRYAHSKLVAAVLFVTLDVAITYPTIRDLRELLWVVDPKISFTDKYLFYMDIKRYVDQAQLSHDRVTLNLLKGYEELGKRYEKDGYTLEEYTYVRTTQK